MFARFLGLRALLIVLLLVPMSRAQDSKSRPPDKSDSTIDADTLKTGDYIGKLVAPPASDGLFTLRIDFYEPKDPATAARAASQLNVEVQKARALEQQVAANPTPQRVSALQQAYNQVRKEQAKQRDLYNISFKDYEFHAASDMMVRYLLPPVVYDDKGERKKFSLLDLREMRGSDPNVPGFEAKVTDLQANQILRVSLYPARTTTPAATSKDKAKSEPKMEVAVAVIVVAEDMTAVNQDNKDTGKKKKGK
jgi:hypothetical protein